MNRIITSIVVSALLLALPASLLAAEAPVIGNLRAEPQPPEIAKLEDIAENGTAAQLRAFLKKSRKFTEAELNGAYTRAIVNQNAGVREELIKAGADPKVGELLQEEAEQGWQ